MLSEIINIVTLDKTITAKSTETQVFWLKQVWEPLYILGEILFCCHFSWKCDLAENVNRMLLIETSINYF